MVRLGIIVSPGVRENESGCCLACNIEWRKTLTSLLLDVDGRFGSELPMDAVEGDRSRLLEGGTNWDDHGASTVLLNT